LDGTDVVVDPNVYDDDPADPISERRVENAGSEGQPDLAVSVASSRILFIRRFASGSGTSEEVLERRWSDIKNG
jgi:hypothetical protein